VKLARLSAAKKSLFIKYLLDEPMNWLKKEGKDKLEFKEPL
jgi:ABC-type transport system involved in cytochrome c biogenesis ATPase subunit